ncbi:MAG: hypothetical protein C0467_32275 [Planctomycetaceae bacterium]|nr:hypothetical protein [Planctomycetaceae bacterium]
MKEVVVATVLAAFVFAMGCAKVAPQAGKAIVGGEKAAVKSAPYIERSGGRVASAGAVGEVAPGTGRVASSASRRWADRFERADNAQDKACEAYDILWEIVNSPSGGSLGSFPRPASEVRPVSDQRIVIDPQSGGYALPNNFNGFNFYTPKGEPLGFCAYYSVRDEMHFFNDKGIRIG